MLSRFLAGRGQVPCFPYWITEILTPQRAPLLGGENLVFFYLVTCHPVNPPVKVTGVLRPPQDNPVLRPVTLALLQPSL